MCQRNPENVRVVTELEEEKVVFCMLKNGVKSMSSVREKKQCVQLSVMHPCSLETHTSLMTVHFSLFS